MVAPFSSEQYVQIRHLIEGAAKAYQNAEDLFREASLLYAHGAFCRALFLHQISMEECGKIEMLAAWVVGILSGHEIDDRKVTRALASHRAKNNANAYFLPVQEAERQAHDAAKISAAVEAFNEMQAAFHSESNVAKNSSLYVDFENGEFSAPNERITESMVQEIARTNADFLALASHKVEVMSHWKTNPDETSRTMASLLDRIKNLRSEAPADLEKALMNLVEELLTEAKRLDNPSENGVSGSS